MTITPRFLAAMGTYALLAALAVLTLDGPIRLATWVFLGGLALKTVLNTLQTKS